MQFDFNSLTQSVPLLLLLCTGLVLMLADAFKFDKTSPSLLPALTGIGLIASIISATPGLGSNATQYGYYYNDMIAFGGFASIVHIFLCISGLVSLFFIEDFLTKHKKEGRDVYALIVFAIIGMVMLANANDLIIVFIGLEIMSVCLYILAGLFPRNLGSNESALKYFLLGAFASAFLLYGVALLYGISGIDGATGPTMKLHKIAAMVDLLKESSLFYIALGLILTGFLFKVAAFPFHAWTPDVYTGTPTPLAGFMATGSKMAAFIAFSMFLMRVIPLGDPKIVTILAVLGVVSMYFGNIVAVQQKNIKRMLAYSSIAHTGYMLLGLSAGQAGYMAVIFYMFVYTLMTVGAFGVISMVETRDEDAELSHWRGLGMRKPWVAAAMSTFMFALAGMPPLAGFMGKYMIFGAAVQEQLYLPAILGILSSVIGAYYYLRVIVVMYFQKTEDMASAEQTSSALAPLAGAMLLCVLLIILGMFPSLVHSYLDNLYSAAGFMTSIQR